MFLLRRKRQTGVTDEQIRNIISSKLDLEASKIKQAGGGLINDVFFAETEKGDVVLRVSPRKEARFAGERWALGQCFKRDIPVPKVLAFGTVKTKLPYPCQYLLLEKAQGNPLVKVTRGLPFLLKLHLTEGGIKNYLKEAGHILSKIHAIKTEGFGYLGSDGKGSFQSWKEFLLSHINTWLLNYLLENRVIKKGLKNRILDIFDSKKTYLELKSPMLLHGDFFYDHIFVDKGKISGIIDFENCISGDPLYDLANFELYHDIGWTPSPLPYLLGGYHAKFTKEELEERLVFYKLQKVPLLIWWWKEERKELGNSLRLWRLSSLLKRYLRELE